MTRAESWVITAIAIAVSIAMAVAIWFFDGVGSDHDAMLERLERMDHTIDQRVKQVETMKVPATARRFTADDGEASYERVAKGTFRTSNAWGVE